MNVINGRLALLSNFEVFQLLKELQNGKNGYVKLGKDVSNLTNITNETISYLEKTVCKEQSPESFSEIMKGLAPFNLTKAEKLQIVNQLPQSAVEVQLIVEECEERMSVEDIDNLIAVIAKFVIPNS